LMYFVQLRIAPKTPKPRVGCDKIVFIDERNK